MIGLPDVIALIMLLSLVLYVLLGGADFGGGLWDLLARGPRAEAQRRLIERAIAPMWEANHVWLILVVVLLFSGFPRAFAVAATALHVPLSLMLLGIVLRGSAFTFRHYGAGAGARRWGRVFAGASVFTPIFLGMTLGAVSAGEIRARGGLVEGGFFAPWIGLFPLSVGLLALALFAFLAAVYLCCEAEEAALQDDFRRRALGAGVAVGPAALLGGLSAAGEAAHFKDALLHAPWSWPLQIATGAVAIGALAALYGRRYPLARACAIGQATLIVMGWGLAQRPYLIVPDVTIAGAAAPAVTLRLLLGALVLGALVLVPSLGVLFRVFKQRRDSGASPPH
ncbi:MAG TPA: cytochrome d ubiquinol oxidase subunit II [Polyangia bacterium]|nr:cytochrome d ubiquinol oxidase subunit II [Polyangia bacterium]